MIPPGTELAIAIFFASFTLLTPLLWWLRFKTEERYYLDERDVEIVAVTSLSISLTTSLIFFFLPTNFGVVALAGYIFVHSLLLMANASLAWHDYDRR